MVPFYVFAGLAPLVVMPGWKVRWVFLLMVYICRGQVIPPNEFARKIAVDGNFVNRVKNFGSSLEYNWHGDNMTFTSISSYRDYKAFGLGDVDRKLMGAVSDRAGMAHLASLMHAYWVQFAKTGNPNGSGQEYWPEAIDKGTEKTLIFDNGGARVATNFKKQQLDFQHQLYVQRMQKTDGQ